MADEKRYGGHTAAEVIELMGMLAAQHDVHSADEALAIARRGSELLKDQALKLGALQRRLDIRQDEDGSVHDEIDRLRFTLEQADYSLEQYKSRFDRALEALRWLGDGHIDDVTEMMDYARAHAVGGRS